MNKILKISLIVFVVGSLIGVMIYFGKKNNQPELDFDVKSPFKTTIERKTVATGKVVPEIEVAIKPQISGIIKKIYVEEGSFVEAGDLIATIKIVPNEKSLNIALGQLKTAEIQFKNIELEYIRNKKLFSKGVIADQTFDNIEAKYQQATQDLENAKNDYQIIKVGSSSGSTAANTNILATVSGTILEIPVKPGDQVIESNNFNAGTTIATIADLNKMIFEGKVDEAEVRNLKENVKLEVTIGAIQNKKFYANLDFIAPKGVNEQGAVLFTIKGTLHLNNKHKIRAGYSANAILILEKKENILAIKESLVQYDRSTEEPFVEILVDDKNFERKNITLGVSDGINVEILSGVSKSDKIKVWNKASSEGTGS